MNAAPPSLLCFVVPDDAMEPRARPGQFAYFDPDLTPRAGDGVLVVDARGRTCFRLFRPGPTPGQWYAVAINPRFAELDGGSLGLCVIGVYVGLRGRFADDLAAQAAAVQQGGV